MLLLARYARSAAIIINDKSITTFFDGYQFELKSPFLQNSLTDSDDFSSVMLFFCFLCWRKWIIALIILQDCQPIKKKLSLSNLCKGNLCKGNLCMGYLCIDSIMGRKQWCKADST